MSRANPTNSVEAPVERWIGFNGKHGKFSFKGESGYEDMALPLRLMYLDRAYQVGDRKKGGNWVNSNVVRFTSKSTFRVRYHGSGVVHHEGKWSEIGQDVKDTMGGKLHMLMFFLDTVTQDIWCFKVSGRCFFEMSNFYSKWKKSLDSDHAFLITDVKVFEGGDTSNASYVPVFDLVPAQPNEIELAGQAALKVEDYLAYIDLQNQDFDKQEGLPTDQKQVSQDPEVQQAQVMTNRAAETTAPVAEAPGGIMDGITSDDVASVEPAVSNETIVHLTKMIKDEAQLVPAHRDGFMTVFGMAMTKASTYKLPLANKTEILAVWQDKWDELFGKGEILKLDGTTDLPF